MNHKKAITAKCCHASSGIHFSLFFNIFTNLMSPVSKIAAAVCSNLAAVVGLAVRQPELLLLISSSADQCCGDKTTTQHLGTVPAGVKKGREIYMFCLSENKKNVGDFMEEFTVTHFCILSKTDQRRNLKTLECISCQHTLKHGIGSVRMIRSVKFCMRTTESQNRLG